MNKIDIYTTALGQAQMSDEHRQKVEEAKLGKSHMGEGLAYEFEQAKELATKRGLNVKSCAFCGHPAFIRDIRHGIPLCDACNGSRDEIEFRLKNNHSILGGSAVLDENDKRKVISSKTVSRGPYWDPKHPDKKVAPQTARPRDKSL